MIPQENRLNITDIRLEGGIVDSVDAIPLGNGLSGGLLWGKGSEIYLSLDRGDLWDLRPCRMFTNPAFTYDTLVAMVRDGRYDEDKTIYQLPGGMPTKVPGARLVIRLTEGAELAGFTLDLQRAAGSAKWRGAGGAVSVMECFFSTRPSVAMARIPVAGPKFHLAPNPCFTRDLNLPAAEVSRGAGWASLVQPMADGFSFAIHVQSREKSGRSVLAASITTTAESPDPLALARQRTSEALGKGYDSLLREHERWWSDFWNVSSVRIPDEALQVHYNLVQYLYGAGSRRGSPPIALQGVWTWDNGQLPPWRGDYHNDLNTQLTYWAYQTSGRFEAGLSFLDFLWALKPEHERWSQRFFGVSPGHIVPGVMGLDGTAMGLWFPVPLSTTMGAWLAQNFHLHWLYTQDERFLSERAYPYCAGIGRALLQLLKPDPATGKLKLPLSTSPEIGANTAAAWLTPNSNFDLALLRWLFAANAEMAKVLGLNSEAEEWNTARGQLDELATDGENGPLRLSPDKMITETHRHLSHLMAIYPLGLLHTEGTPREQAILDASLRHLESLGDDSYMGYSHAWAACMNARSGRPDRALEHLHHYLKATRRNGFHCNRPDDPRVTLEGNFAAAQAVHEMLLQSWGGKIRVFPAMPGAWREVSFDRLRTEGGFIVSARREAGLTVEVSVTATVDQRLKLVNPFAGLPFQSNLETESCDGLIMREMKAGEWLVMKTGPNPQVP